MMRKEQPQALTIKKRISLCWEILTASSGHNHHAQLKQLSTFTEGYAAGYKDGFIQSNIKPNSSGRVNMEPIA
jgi:hypothetical protein